MIHCLSVECLSVEITQTFWENPEVNLEKAYILLQSTQLRLKQFKK